MQEKHIYDRNKSRAMAWALQQPNGLRCTICGATGSTLTLADIDIFHTRFVARCDQHLETAPKIRSIYGIVLESRQELAVTHDAKWFSDNPQRTHRLRSTIPDERERYPRSGELMLVRKLAGGNTDRISVWVSDHGNLAGDDEALCRMFDLARNAGVGKPILVSRGGAA